MKITQELLYRYHRGECTDKEIREVEEWLTNGTADTTFDKVEKEDEHLAGAWQELSAHMDSGQGKSRRLYVWPLGIVAGVALLLALGLVFYGQIKQLFVEQKTISYSNGEYGRIILDDKSTVHLNSGATLQYPSFFAGNTREVTLTKGEAFFDIANDERHPFIIHMDKVDVKVLGTRFNIKNNFRGAEIEIILVEGKIRFYADQKEYTLIPGQQLTYNKKTRDIKLNNDVNTNRVMAWTKGILWFEDTPMPEVFKALEQRYGIQFKIEKRADIPFTAKFKNEPLDRILQLIEISTGLQFKKDKNHITVY